MADVAELQELARRPDSQGNKGATIRPLAELVGAVRLEGLRRFGRASAEVEPEPWRGWWNMGRVVKREVRKAQAVARCIHHNYHRAPILVARWRGGLSLERVAFTELTEDQQGDTAEAILLGVGAAMRASDLGRYATH